MSSNKDILGIAVLLVLINARGKGGLGGLGILGSLGIQPSSSPLDMARTINNFHHVTQVINKIDSLGQTALNPPPINQILPMVSNDDGPFNIGKIVKTISPIVDSLGNNYQGDDENQNALF